MTEHELSLRSACVPVVSTIAAIWLTSCVGMIAMVLTGIL